MNSIFFRRSFTILLFLFVSLAAHAEKWIPFVIDSYVSAQAPWFISVRPDSAGTESWSCRDGQNLMVIMLVKSGAESPDDMDGLSNEYKRMISDYVSRLHGQLTDSSTLDYNGVIAKKIHVQFKPPGNDTGYVADCIFIIGNNRVYTLQYLQPAALASSNHDADYFLNSIKTDKYFTHDHQFKREDRSSALERGFVVGQVIGYLLILAALLYFLRKLLQRQNRLR
ncbi:MAG TPA: hypothetical protein VFU15_11855 [Bacteroidia bacterium]|nr:hypothetical protein [Bacteroidia bacterium]